MIYHYECPISGIALGVGITPDEAKANAQHNPDAVRLTVKRSTADNISYVHVGVLHKPTTVVVSPIGTPLFHPDDAERCLTVELPVSNLPPADQRRACDAVADRISNMLRGLFDSPAQYPVIAGVAALLDGIVNVTDVEAAPLAMMAPKNTKDTSTENIAQIAFSFATSTTAQPIANSAANPVDTAT